MTEAAAPRTILFADVVGSTALYRRLGDTRAEALIRLAMERLSEIAKTQNGRLVKTIGDCGLCEFPDANSAALAATEMQRQARTPLAPDEGSLFFRIGFMQGPVVSRQDDIFGDAVNLAARLCDIAKTGQILTAESTAEYLDPEMRAGVRLFDQTPIKGVEGSLTIVQLLWDRRAATEVFVVPSAAGAGAVSLALEYAGAMLLLSGEKLPFTLGREPGCSLIVASPCASRVHARIELHRGKFNLVDESTNGTYVLPDDGPVERAIYIRREAFPLLGRGVFALGERPVPKIPHLLRYEIS